VTTYTVDPTSTGDRNAPERHRRASSIMTYGLHSRPDEALPAPINGIEEACLQARLETLTSSRVVGMLDKGVSWLSRNCP
jgi:hypothetical protein